MSLTEPAIKRTIDIAVALVLVVILLPVFLMIAIAISIESRGPVFYTARRVGRHGTEFGLLKFRKMTRDAAGPPLTVAGDARFTRLGPLLSRLRLDELPQILNVLRGDMSLVGPRPEDPYFVALRRAEFREVLSVRPGITGWTQLVFADEASLLAGPDPVHRYVTELLPLKVRLDQLYARTWSLLTDLQLLLWTPLVVFLGFVVLEESPGVLRVRRPRSGAPLVIGDPTTLRDTDPGVVIDLRDAVIDLRDAIVVGAAERMEPEVSTQPAH